MKRTPSTFLGVRQSETVDHAFRFAKFAHQGQRRQFSGGPYLAHPLRVARTVAKFPHTTEMVAAALLHDVVEDTDFTIDEIEARFGSTVAGYVDALTCRLTPADGNRVTRKRMERERLSSAKPEVATIKLADIKDNCRNIVVESPKFAEVYLPESMALAVALSQGHQALRKQVIGLVQRQMDKLQAWKELDLDAVCTA